MKIAIIRSVLGYIVFLPFCYLWRVDGYSMFALLSVLYFIPFHHLFDKLLIKNNIREVN